MLCFKPEPTPIRNQSSPQRHTSTKTTRMLSRSAVANTLCLFSCCFLPPLSLPSPKIQPFSNLMFPLHSAGPGTQPPPPAARPHKGQSVGRVISLGWSWTLTPETLDVFQPQTGRHNHIMDMCALTRGQFHCGRFGSIYHLALVTYWSPVCAAETMSGRSTRCWPGPGTSHWPLDVFRWLIPPVFIR